MILWASKQRALCLKQSKEFHFSFLLPVPIFLQISTYEILLLKFCFYHSQLFFISFLNSSFSENWANVLCRLVLKNFVNLSLHSNESISSQRREKERVNKEGKIRNRDERYEDRRRERCQKEREGEVILKLHEKGSQASNVICINLDSG